MQYNYVKNVIIINKRSVESVVNGIHASILINMTSNSMSKEYIYSIEDLPFRPIDIWYVFLVVFGKKSSSWLFISSDIWRDGQTAKHLNQNIINSIKAVFDAVGLKYEFRISISNAGISQSDVGPERLSENCEIFIAKNENIISDLVKAVGMCDHKEIGELLGFPITAVEAFATKELIKKSDLEPEIRFSEVASFTQFMLSKENWKDEMAIVADWVDCLKSVSIITYYECRKQLRVLDDETREILINYYKNTELCK